MSNNFHELSQQLIHVDETMRQSALQTLLTLDEDAVVPLVDQLFAGVSEPVGVAILEVIAIIGGPDAMSALKNVFYFEQKPAIKHAAAQGLRENQIALNGDELRDVEEYFTGHLQ